SRVPSLALGSEHQPAGCCRGARARWRAGCLPLPLPAASGSDSVSIAGAPALAQALHSTATLEVLHLGLCCVGDAGAIALAAALHLPRGSGRGDGGLRQLHLRENNITPAAPRPWVRCRA